MKRIAVIGDYNPKEESHRLILESIKDAAAEIQSETEAQWIMSDALDVSEEHLKHFDGFWFAPGSPYRNADNVLSAIQYARENRVPALGTCAGFQHMVIEFARNVLGLHHADSEENDTECADAVIGKLSCTLMNKKEQLIIPDSDFILAQAAGGQKFTGEYRCNYGFNEAYRSVFQNSHMISAIVESENGCLRGFGLKDHPFFIGTLFIPQLDFRGNGPCRIIKSFVKAVSGMSRTDLQDCFMLEDRFPKSFTGYEERPYGILFYNTQNRNSFDSNHAVIFRDKIINLSDTLKEIIAFYLEKGLTPMIYQSAGDNGYFAEIEDDLAREGFDSWIEEQKFMVLTAENRITPNENLVVRKVQSWDPSFEQVFTEAEEPWETEVLKKSLEDPNTALWVAYLADKPIGILYCLTDGKVCRGNYVLVSKQHRNVGAGRALTYHYAEWCKASGIQKAFHWPDGERPEKIYLEAGFRHVETVYAGRAVYKQPKQ